MKKREIAGWVIIAISVLSILAISIWSPSKKNSGQIDVATSTVRSTAFTMVANGAQMSFDAIAPSQNIKGCMDLYVSGEGTSTVFIGTVCGNSFNIYKNH